MDLQLTGHSVFVSGSTQGIGYAIAETLAREGARVILNGRTRERCEAAVDRLRAAVPGIAVSSVATDFEDPEQVAALLAKLSRVDVLVNNVGVFDLMDFFETDDTTWQRYLEVDLMSAVRLSRGLLPGMLERGWGRIISVASESGVNVQGDMIPYGVAKAGMIALGNGLAKLTSGTRVTVNTILGGPTYSDGVAGVVDAISQEQGLPVGDVKRSIEGKSTTSLLGRFLEPEEIAHLAAFLASPMSSATNGAALRADGGVLTAML
ncbi:MAG TPA: SDR family oxidoreductase [Candidatus Agrococcus pullicola]|uniref:SDR family oxidoreductase n=1 Tax=Candidatus Agrococcus pullicola TaxID=2838429 RepID=A0A9D1Z0C5_9MICO|nr:SDR family oxidoreductase [Candidatus Agrococcus pullicola]